VVRAVAEKLVREWDQLGIPEPLPPEVQHLAAGALGRGLGRRSVVLECSAA
jgi:hypothetical protein